MSVDKLVDSTQLDADLTSVANAIRTKGGTSADLAFPAGFVSAVQAIPTGGTDYGKDYSGNGINTLCEMFYAIEHNLHHSGTVTPTSYYPTNAESVFCDTGFSDTLRGMVIFDVDQPASGTNVEALYETLGFFGRPATAGEDQGISSASGVTKYRGGAVNSFLGQRMTSRRINGGKLYIKPQYAQAAYTLLIQNHTYRWIAWPYLD